MYNLASTILLVPPFLSSPTRWAVLHETPKFAMISSTLVCQYGSSATTTRSLLILTLRGPLSSHFLTKSLAQCTPKVANLPVLSPASIAAQPDSNNISTCGATTQVLEIPVLATLNFPSLKPPRKWVKCPLKPRLREGALRKRYLLGRSQVCDVYRHHW